MIVKETKLKDCFLLEPKVFGDDRGYFLECYNQNTFNELTGLDVQFVQDNESFSSRGVLRGLHFQRAEHAQAKLVRVIQGSVLDIAVDLRKDSETFGEYIAVELNADNKKQLFVPRGFAHGFVVLSETALFSYKCDNFYNKASEGGIIYNDNTLNIDWKIEASDLIISEKDLILPNFENIVL
ncbi:dTDP-4-dehydrorhamnose 3,5-epimerase [Pseudotamlana agarivorans]|uniref:dTDP-4-dehydrorhamnose 3,5-epimerase n=1 Tax=Pseudotamlana agarivorans TaxID=481183 RepID=UPI00082D7414|nr:dTDP-4-dehydrorhamnose 3,5-epimerase [Tamlana agarivorans]